MLPDGELVVGCGKEWFDYFPMGNIGKYQDLWAKWEQEWKDKRDAENILYNRNATHVYISPSLEFKNSKNVWVYKANLKLRSFSKGNKANDKVFWIDSDTGAHYSMDVADMYEMVNGFAEWIVVANPETWIITAEVFPNTRWGTTFLSVFTKEMKAAIELVNDTAAKRKSEKLKPKEFIVGNVYNTSLEWEDAQWNKEVYLWYGTVEFTWNIYSSWNFKSETEVTVEKGNIFVNFREYGNPKSEFCHITVRKGMITAYKNLGKHELSIESLVEKAHSINKWRYLISLNQ